MLTQPPDFNHNKNGLIRTYLSQQQTIPYPAITAPVSPTTPANTPAEPDQSATPAPTSKRQLLTRAIAIAVLAVLGLVLYVVWHGSTPPTTSPTITQQSFASTPSSSTASTTMNGGMQAYIAGAVRQPGVYTLTVGARVYQLLQAAGGPLPNANLALLNLAAKLSDGQEIYVATIGQTPPASAGASSGNSDGNSTSSGSTTTTGQISINTASVTELRQGLHISLTSANAIVNYREQHGNYTSVDELLQVVSKSIYNKIKTLVTL